MRSIYSLLFMLSAFFFSSLSNASSVDYWQLYVSGGSLVPAEFSSALSACQSYNTYGSPTYRLVTVSATNVTCYRTVSGNESNIGSAYKFTRTCQFGNTGTTCNSSCNAPSVMQNGQCVAPAPDPCAGKSGGSQKFTKSGTSGDGYGAVVGGFVVAPQSGCFGGCAVSTVDQKCTGRTSGKYTCRGTASFSGQSCATSGSGTEIQDNTANEPKPDPQVIVEDKPCVYSASGDTQTCTSEKNNEKEGQYCGVVNGVKTCVDSKPTKNGISIQTTVKTETKADGSKVTTKTDVATKTNCTGAGQCTSTSTTTTTTTNTNSSGATTGTTGSCTGDSCPDKNTNPDGDGDGFGDCTGTDCGEGAGGDGELLKPELEEVDSYQETTEKFYNRVNNAPLFSAVGNIHAPIVGTAPTLVSAPIAALGGASLDLSFIDELKPILSSILSFVMKAVWCLLALVIFLSA